MHIPAEVRAIYAQSGPFATVYLDATRSTESGGHEVELRWQEQRSHLKQAGADEPTLAAIDDALAEHREASGAHGQVVVGAAGNTVLNAVLPRPPIRPIAAWAPLPHLMPYFAQCGPQIPHVVVLADRTGADVETAPAGGSATRDSVEGSRQYPITKTSVRDWSERHFQQRVENSWKENARDVADAVHKHVADISAELVVLAGDPRARSLLADDLKSVLPQDVEVVEVEQGGRGSGSSAESLGQAVHDALLRRSWRERHELLTHLQQNLGRHEYAVVGTAEVLDSVRKSQADTVVVSDDPASTLKAWFGPEPLQAGTTAAELQEMGVAEPRQDRFDAVLVRAIAASGAQLVVTPNAHDYLHDGIGALLRYADRSTPVP